MAGVGNRTFGEAARSRSCQANRTNLGGCGSEAREIRAAAPQISLALMDTRGNRDARPVAGQGACPQVGSNLQERPREADAVGDWQHSGVAAPLEQGRRQAA